MGVLNAIVIPYLKNKGNGKKSGKPNSQKSIKQRSMFQRFIFRCYGRLCDPYNESDDFGEEERPLPSKRKESTAFQAPSISSEIAKVSSEYLDWMFYWCCIPIRPPAQTPPVVDRAEARSWFSLRTVRMSRARAVELARALARTALKPAVGRTPRPRGM